MSTGHYLAHEVGQLAGVSGKQIGAWARRGYIKPSRRRGRPHVYSYQDVVEAMAVHELRERGCEAEGSTSATAPDNLRKLASDLERGGWAVRAIPDLRHIEVNPDRLSGTPSIRNRRISAQMVASLAETESGRAALVEDYGLEDDEILDAMRWWRVVCQYERNR